MEAIGYLQLILNIGLLLASLAFKINIASYIIITIYITSSFLFAGIALISN